MLIYEPLQGCFPCLWQCGDPKPGLQLNPALWQVSAERATGNTHRERSCLNVQNKVPLWNDAYSRAVKAFLWHTHKVYWEFPAGLTLKDAKADAG